jgi:hypothetical protein
MKNRESAARSRLRRQQHIQGLEEDKAALRAELDDARQQVVGALGGAVLQGQGARRDCAVLLEQFAHSTRGHSHPMSCTHAHAVTGWCAEGQGCRLGVVAADGMWLAR